MVCQACGREGPTRQVEFYRHVGLIVIGLTKSMKGELCRSCSRKYFRDYTLITLVAGWWGVISVFITPLFLMNNVMSYRRWSSERQAPATELESAVRVELLPQVDYILTRLKNGEDPAQIAKDVSINTGVPVEQAALFIKSLQS